MTDIVIPLSTESKFDNMQLTLALRSIQRYAQNVGNIHVLTAANLPQLKNINIIYQQDTQRHCKDVNLINKIRTAATNKDVRQNFIFWSDDQLLTAPLDLDKAPVVANNRTLKDIEPTSKWRTRLQHTMQYVQKETGKQMPYNFDSHVPQPYKKSKVEEIFSKVPYTVQPGFCINTIYFGMQQTIAEAKQQQVKLTFQGGFNKIPMSLLLYAGYNDKSFENGMQHFFLGMFYQKSSYQV